MASVHSEVQRLRGLARRAPRRSADDPTPDIAIIGAGFSGIGMAIRLKRAGITSFTVFEKNNGVGGTWRDNTYPGAACDVPSHLYSFSFHRRTEWSHLCSPQQEILDYLEDCVDTFGLRPHLRTDTEVSALRWEPDEQLWVLTTTAGVEHRAHMVISALGQLNRPRDPDIEGLDDFAGISFHSARWDHSRDLADLRVGVIGNAASAVQFVPQIAPLAEHVTIFQRSANWILPRTNLRYSDLHHELLERVPGAQLAYRAAVFASMELLVSAFERPGTVARRLEAAARRHLERSIVDPELRAKLTPDYPIGCKRILFNSDYYPAVTREDVSVVDDPIQRIERDAIVTATGERHPVDAIVRATGFEATSFLAPLTVKGRDGRMLDDAWSDGAHAYLGMAVEGFPNLFMLYGPNTNLGHNSILFMVERQIDHIVSLVDQMARRGVRWVDVRADRAAAFDDALQAQLADTVWNADCSSWYRNDSGRITNNWPGSTLTYWWRTALADLDDYDQHSAAGPTSTQH